MRVVATSLVLVIVLFSKPLSAFAQHSHSEADSLTRRSVLLKQELTGEGFADKEVQLVSISYAPGGSTPKHSHPCPTFVYVIEGELESQLEGQSIRIYRAGDTFYEPANAIHLISRNASRTKSTRFLVTFLTSKGEKPTVFK